MDHIFNTIGLFKRDLVLRLSALFFLCLTSTALAGQEADTVSFIHIADTHICNLNGYHPVIAKSRAHYGDGSLPLMEFLNSVPKQAGADFVVITGDMIDFYEGETLDGKILDTQVEQFSNLINNAHLPVFMSLGNHDICTYRVDNIDNRIASDQINANRARSSWIRNATCFRDGTYYSRVFQVDTTTYRLIFLDNAYYADNRQPDRPHFIIDPFQLHWLDNELKKSDSDIEIIFMHMPLFNPDRVDLEPTRNTYRLIPGDTVAHDHKLITADSESNDLYNVLEKNSSVRLILSGHLHSSIIHNVQFSDNYSLIHLMTGAFARDQRNWRQVKLTGNSIIVSFPGETREQYTIRLDYN